MVPRLSIQYTPGRCFYFLWLHGSITLGNKKKHLIQYPFHLLLNIGPEWWAELDDVFRFSNCVLVFPWLYVEIRKKHFFAIVPLQLLLLYTFICINIISKMYIINRTLLLCKDFLVSIARTGKKMPFCLGHGYFHAVNMASNYVGNFFHKTRWGNLFFAYGGLI